MVKQSSSHEHSAGVLIYHLADGQRSYLLLNYGKYWDFPKGHLEPGEDHKTAALRELAEETGLKEDAITLEPGYQRHLTYYFRKRPRDAAPDTAPMLIRKDVCFFLARAKTTEITLSPEHTEFVFLPVAEALEKIKYPTSRELLRLADAHLEKQVG